jgi:hypothetical protein
MLKAVVAVASDSVLAAVVILVLARAHTGYGNLARHV